jgi:predicted O-linked N-acetylglucosamine transferase (SPINDLY family)
VGASLLTAVGHPEWIADDKAAYVRIASELASDPARLKTLRTELRDDMKRSPLLDHAGQAARFGAALRACWIAWCENSVPQLVYRNADQRAPVTTSPR